jgi:lysophospholipase L1-like esterase
MEHNVKRSTGCRRKTKWRRITVSLLLVLLLPTVTGYGEERIIKWRRRLQQFEEADRRSPPKPGGILFVGSSSIERWESLAEDFSPHQVLNRGVGGSHLRHVTRFANRVIIPYRPRMIVLYAGDNDVGAGRTPDQVLAQFYALVKRVHKELPCVTIAFISIKPALARRGLLSRIKETNKKIERYAAEHEHIKYIDVFTAMLKDNGDIRAEFFDKSGRHINRAGYELWKMIIAPQLNKEDNCVSSLPWPKKKKPKGQTAQKSEA